MRKAATRLPSLAPPGTGAKDVFFLTGRRFWYQTAFCFWSLRRQGGDALRLVLIDDGTIDAGVRSECERIFPGSRIVDAAEVTTRLNQVLPIARFPSLRRQRENYLHLRKLTDVHAGLEGWKLVCDSDMLFFRRPEMVLSWLSTPEAPLHMADVQDAYGYPEETLTELAHERLPSKVNVGVFGLLSDAIDWEKVEWWCTQLLQRHGTSYYLEQALCALLLSGKPRVELPAADYVLMPDEAECRRPRAVLHHYVAESKRGYFRHAWKHAQCSG